MGKKWFIVVLVCIVAVGAYAVIRSSQNSGETQIARISQIEKGFASEGFLMKNETILTSDRNGTLQSLVSDGAKVAKGKAVAAVYTGKVDPGVQIELDKVNAQIAEVSNQSESIAYDDVTRVESVLNQRAAALSEAVSRNEIDKIAQIKYEMSQLLDSKFADDKNKTSKEKEIETLKAQKAQLEAKLGAEKSTLYASRPGIYSSVIDGYETYLKPDTIDQLTVSALENIKGSKVQETSSLPSCKIIDNYAWYYAAVVSSEEIAGLQKGQSLKLRFPEYGQETYEATVRYLSPVEDGKVAAVFESSIYMPQLVDKRSLKCDIIIAQYTGFKAPASAVHMKDGKVGVYVKIKGSLVFKETDLVYRTDEFVIIKEDNTKENSVLLYDEIVIRDEDIPE